MRTFQAKRGVLGPPFLCYNINNSISHKPKVMSKRTMIYGIGINDADYLVKPRIEGTNKRMSCPFYLRWKEMLRRCYSEKEHLRNPTYKDCEVVEEWKYFSNFKSWMENQDWEGKHLDKDILVPGNKTYGPNTCIFVEDKINLLLVKCDIRRGKYPLGVSPAVRGDKIYYQSHMGRNYLGFFDNILEAHRSWQIEKCNHIKQVASNQNNLVLKNALMEISNNILKDYQEGKETIDYS